MKKPWKLLKSVVIVRGVIAKHDKPVNFYNLKLEDAITLEGEFDFINCVGVLHHLPEPDKGIQALAKKLKPGGILHVFVYAELGRWEISLMQKAIRFTSRR